VARLTSPAALRAYFIRRRQPGVFLLPPQKKRRARLESRGVPSLSRPLEPQATQTPWSADTHARRDSARASAAGNRAGSRTTHSSKNHNRATWPSSATTKAVRATARQEQPLIHTQRFRQADPVRRNPGTASPHAQLPYGCPINYRHQKLIRHELRPARIPETHPQPATNGSAPPHNPQSQCCSNQARTPNDRDRIGEGTSKL